MREIEKQALEILAKVLDMESNGETLLACLLGICTKPDGLEIVKALENEYDNPTHMIFLNNIAAACVKLIRQNDDARAKLAPILREFVDSYNQMLSGSNRDKVMR